VLQNLLTISSYHIVPPKAKGKFRKEKVKPVSGLDLDAILGPAPKVATISPGNAIPEFKRVLERASSDSDTVDLQLVKDVAKQMGDIVKNLITTSFGGSKDDRALEHLGCMRDELKEIGEPDVYNVFVRELKKRMLAGELDGDRRELWWKIRNAKLGLIDEAQSEESKVTVDEAWEVSCLLLFFFTSFSFAK
jgi:ATP-dependent DNA helicase 2 subunit 2